MKQACTENSIKNSYTHQRERIFKAPPLCTIGKCMFLIFESEIPVAYFVAQRKWHNIVSYYYRSHNEFEVFDCLVYMTGLGNLQPQGAYTRICCLKQYVVFCYFCSVLRKYFWKSTVSSILFVDYQLGFNFLIFVTFWNKVY